MLVNSSSAVESLNLYSTFLTLKCTMKSVIHVSLLARFDATLEYYPLVDVSHLCFFLSFLGFLLIYFSTCSDGETL